MRIAYLLFVLLVVTLGTVNADRLIADEPVVAQEYYEIRTYKIFDYDKQQIAEKYLENALVPALNRQGLDRVGVFTNVKDENDHSMYVVIPYPTIDKFTSLNDNLAADKAYQTAAANYFDRDKKTAVYTRIESRFTKAFSGIPVMEIPSVTTEKKDRIFEMRLYESPTEDHARRKVQMFNEGEIQTMRDTKLAPVFFGETLIGPSTPNLIYMLSSPDMESHKQHFKDFMVHPDWIKIKDLPQYKGTVSKIQNWFLTPTSYSQL